jgi:Fuc2NAc and GlcNAc transferase
MMLFVYGGLAALLAVTLTALIRKYALSNQIMDIPNGRSSHAVPTPRGGGVAIVLTFLVMLVVLYISDNIAFAPLMAYLGCGAIIALIGFIDDHDHVPARWRLLGHFAGACWTLYWLGGFPPFSLFGFEISLAWSGYVLAAVYMVWALNLYNFMDGIDGLASTQAISVCVLVAVIYYANGHSLLAAPLLILSMATAGFLVWNFPPAKIFMGDAGSGFLGVILASFSVQAGWVDEKLFPGSF